MPQQTQAPNSQDDYTLELFCAKTKTDAFRIHVWPGWLPGFLRKRFDKDWEAYPVYIDVDELDRQMEISGVTYHKRVSSCGSVQLTASGSAAMVLAVWLAQSFATGTSTRADARNDSSLTKGDELQS